MSNRKSSGDIYASVEHIFYIAPCACDKGELIHPKLHAGRCPAYQAWENDVWAAYRVEHGWPVLVDELRRRLGLARKRA